MVHLPSGLQGAADEGFEPAHEVGVVLGLGPSMALFVLGALQAHPALRAADSKRLACSAGTHTLCLPWASSTGTLISATRCSGEVARSRAASRPGSRPPTPAGCGACAAQSCHPRWGRTSTRCRSPRHSWPHSGAGWGAGSAPSAARDHRSCCRRCTPASGPPSRSAQPRSRHRPGRPAAGPDCCQPARTWRQPKPVLPRNSTSITRQPRPVAGGYAVEASGWPPWAGPPRPCWLPASGPGPEPVSPAPGSVGCSVCSSPGGPRSRLPPSRLTSQPQVMR